MQGIDAAATSNQVWPRVQLGKVRLRFSTLRKWLMQVRYKQLTKAQPILKLKNLRCFRATYMFKARTFLEIFEKKLLIVLMRTSRC